MQNSITTLLCFLVTFAVFEFNRFNFAFAAETKIEIENNIQVKRRNSSASLPHPHQIHIGKRLFNLDWKAFPGPKPHQDGLGPLFNRVSCAGCHTKLGRGRPPETPYEPFTSMILRSAIQSEETSQPHPLFGAQIQDRALPHLTPEASPKLTWQNKEGAYADGTKYTLRFPEYKLTTEKTSNEVKNIILSGRVAQPLFGIGLLDAISEKSLKNISDPEDKNNDGISGRINWISQKDGTQKAGRFGWKAGHIDLKHQTAIALHQDMGLTNPLFPQQNCLHTNSACQNSPAENGLEITESQLKLLLEFQRHIPPLYIFQDKNIHPVSDQKAVNPSALKKGKEIFHSIGCASCHLPSWELEEPYHLHNMTVSEILKNTTAQQKITTVTTFSPYTDLLLHDMGPNLADNLWEGQANGREWRTAPLWGIAYRQPLRLLHDGRARSIAEAILWHGGEAETAKEGFKTLSATDRAALIDFVNNL